MKNKFEKILFYFVPVLLSAILLFFVITGLPEMLIGWFMYVLPLFIGSYLLEQGKAFGCLAGVMLGIDLTVGGFREIPRIINMGNAGPRIEPMPEIYWRCFWSTGIWATVLLSLFFAALGIYVLIKNRKQKTPPLLGEVSAKQTKGLEL